MKSLLSFFSSSQKRALHQGAAAGGVSKSKSHTLSERVWHDLGKAYYLFDTLKLSYYSHLGNVTIEKISPSSIEALISENLPHIFGGEQGQYQLSICAITKQRSGDAMRTKAIANAATLRVRKSQTQALFLDPELGLDRAAGTQVQYEFKRGVKRMNNLSVHQFIAQLEEANHLFKQEFSVHSGIKSDNFDALFSENELQSLARFGA